MKENKTTIKSFLQDGKGSLLAAGINAIFAIAGLISVIMMLTQGLTGVTLVNQIIRLVVLVAALILGGAMLLVRENKAGTHKLAIGLFVVSIFLIYYFASSFIIAVMYIFSAALLLIDIVRERGTKQPSAETTQKPAEEAPAEEKQDQTTQTQENN